VIEAEPVPLPFREEYLVLLVEELVGNACKFSAAGTPVAVKGQGERAFWSLTISNRGTGPSAEQIAEFTIAAAEEMARLNLVPKAALLSRSNFGSGSSVSGTKMRRALALVNQLAPGLEIDGEMHGDCALDAVLRTRILPTSPLKGAANLLVCPNVDAGNIAYNLLKTAAGCNVAVGPFLLGVNAPIHILTSSSTVRRIVNMAALTVIDANRG